MKKILFSLCMALFAASGCMFAMETTDLAKASKKGCCYGGVIACLQRRVTTPLWVAWKGDELYLELEQAVEEDEEEKVSRLLSYGLNPNGISRWDNTVFRFLDKSIQRGSLKSLQQLLAAGAVPYLYEMQLAGMQEDGIEMLDALSKAYVAAKKDDRSALNALLARLIVDKAHGSSVQNVLDAGASIHEEYRGVTPLEYAAEIGNQGMVLFLLEHGAIVTPRALHNGICSQKKLIVDALLRKHPAITQSMAEGLSFEAAVRNMLKEEESKSSGIYLSDGALYAEQMPCHIGLLSADPEMIEYLYRLGVNINWQNRNHETVLWPAGNFCDVNERQLLRVCKLIDCGVLIDIERSDGQTVVHHLAQNGRKKLLTCLLTHPMEHLAKALPSEGEQLVQDVTGCHMVLVRKLLSHSAGKQESCMPYELASHESLKRQLSPEEQDIDYHWRSKVEREYRYLINTGKIYSLHNKSTK